ncbi:RNA polymerase sigma factor, partial [Kitasatospora sp. NPDC058965]|uniref:RNA polymerase sigma factor n=1 Tax=Kitasatospora sp. NPDC058965 TaxID=3346682 RepID=UPI0036AB5A12
MTETPPDGPDGPQAPGAPAALVRAAQAGDAGALDLLVADHLPLVYNIVGRALGSAADADDVVQEVMLQLVRDVRQVRDPGAFRSWLVTIAVREAGRHRQARSSAAATGGSEALTAGTGLLADPAADFVDLTITVLSLSGQRRETVEATRWLDADEQQLLSLWWMEVAGRLTRPELAEAMELSLPQTAVRVQRMKARLEVARAAVRALRADPRCAGLREELRGWDGQPGGLWRKRIARHLRTCPTCGDVPGDLVVAERLLADLALVSVPPVLLALLAPNLAAIGGGGAATGSAAAAGRGAAALGRAGSGAARAGSSAIGKTVLLGAVALITVVAGAVGLSGRHEAAGGGPAAPTAAAVTADRPVPPSPPAGTTAPAPSP